MKYLLISLLLLMQGCTCFVSVGKQYEFDELVIRKYQSKTDVPPELLEKLLLLVTEENALDGLP